MNPRAFTAICAAAIVSFGIPAAGAKPNFTGNWKIDAGKTDFGPMPAPEKMERKIAHEDPSLKWSQTQSSPQGEVTSEMAYTTDGKPATNRTPRGETTGAAKWDGDVLAINSKREVQGMEITQAERWTLSKDGKVLTIVNKITTPQGEFDVKLVMDKQ